MQTGTELMAAYFGVPTAARPELEADQERQLELLAQGGRSDVEEAELEAIEKKLQPYLASTELWDLPSPDDLVVDDSDETGEDEPGEDEDDEPAALTEEKGS